MKPEELLLALEDIDEKYVNEATPKDNASVKRKHIMKRVSLIAACIMLCIVNLWLFIPASAPSVPDISALEGNPYYDLIEKLNNAANKSEYYKNNFDRVRDNLGLIFSDISFGDDSGIQQSPPTDYKEIKYLNVSEKEDTGIISGTNFEIRGEYTYVLTGSGVEVWRDGEDQPCIGTVFQETYSTSIMYISDDGKKVTMLSKNKLLCVDLENEQSRKYPDVISFNGSIIKSWMVNGKLIIVTSATVKGDADFSSVESFIPQISHLYGAPFQYLQNNTMVIPENFTSAVYCTAMLFDFDTMVQESAVTVYSVDSPSWIYATEDSVYISGIRGEKNSSGFLRYAEEYKRDIHRISVEGKMLEYCGSAEIDGTTSVDYIEESDDRLKIVAKKDRSNYKKTLFGDRWIDTEESILLYFVDSRNGMRILNSVEVPLNAEERICSVTYKEDKVCVHTVPNNSETIFTPVYVFDVSDIMNVTYTQSVDAELYSPYLIDYSEYCVGIPMNPGLKLELYKKNGDGLELVQVYKDHGKLFGYYRELFVDRERKLLGMCIEEYDRNWRELGYYKTYKVFVVFNIENGSFEPIFKMDIGENVFYSIRYVDDALYMFRNNDPMPLIIRIEEILQGE